MSDKFNEYMKLMHSHAKSGDWDSAIKYARMVPKNWDAWQQLTQHNIPPHALEKVINAVPYDQRAGFHYELGKNLHKDLSHDQLDLLHSRTGDDFFVRNKLEAHLESPTWIDKVRKFEKVNKMFDALYKTQCDDWLLRKAEESKPKGTVEVPYQRPDYSGIKTVSHDEHHASHYPEGFHFNDAQKQLVNGLDVNNKFNIEEGVSRDKYQTINSSNKEVVMKHSHGVFAGLGVLDPETGKLTIGKYHHEVNPAKREVMYHNAAHQLFGMGHVVPTTGIVKLNGHDHSVQEWVEGDGAYHRSPYENSKHKEIYDQWQNDGTLDKMSIMDVISGNHDRHSRNYLIHTDDQGKHHPKLIDNGSSFEYPETTHMINVPAIGHKDLPDYHEKHEGDSPLHPDAARMLHSMSSGKTKEFFKSHGLTEDHPIVNSFIARLVHMQNAHRANPKITRHELLKQAIVHTGGQVRSGKDKVSEGDLEAHTQKKGD